MQWLNLKNKGEKTKEKMGIKEVIIEGFLKFS